MGNGSKASSKAAAVDWRDQLTLSGSGYAGDEHNVLTALRNHPDLVGLPKFNEFGLTVHVDRERPWPNSSGGTLWTELDDTHATAWLQSQKFKVRGPAVVAACVVAIAAENKFHPVRDYLQGLTWDGVPRLDGWLMVYLGAEGPERYLEAIGRKFFNSIVARVMKPGCQVDHVLVMEGLQGAGKTSAARILAVRPEWFCGSLPDMHGKDAALQLAGRLIVELSEMSATRRSQQEVVKSFLSQTADVFRPPYARRTIQVPRQCVFIGTTNEAEYLRDRTGNRRFWPVRCMSIDLKQLERDRDQLYAEAFHAFQAGEVWHLTGDEVALAQDEQAARMTVTEIEAGVSKYLEGLSGKEVTVRDCLVFGLGLNSEEPAYAERAKRLGPEVAEAIQRCGWRKVGRSARDGVRETRYRR